MDDQKIIDFFTCDGKVVSKRFRREYIERNGDGVMEYLMERFKDVDQDTPLSEIVYRIRNGIEVAPRCEVCGGHLRFKHNGYQRFCSKECKYSEKGKMLWQDDISSKMMERYGVKYTLESDILKEKVHKVVRERYGVDNVFQADEIRKKVDQTKLERYGDVVATRNEEVKDKIRRTNEERYYNVPERNEERQAKSRQTMLERYGVEHAMLADAFREKARRSNKERYGDECFVRTERYKTSLDQTIQTKYGSWEALCVERYEKSRKSLMRNKVDGMTPIERQTMQYLSEKYSSVMYDSIVDDRYPYHVDFYIKDIDLFLEINAFWTHGPHRFDPKSDDDLRLAEEWRRKGGRYLEALDVWTVRDVRKHECAERNGLNYLAVYTNKFEEIKEALDERH